jgi:hypothetical protein
MFEKGQIMAHQMIIMMDECIILVAALVHDMSLDKHIGYD